MSKKNPTRAERFASQVTDKVQQAVNLLSEAKDEAETLRDELQSWRDNLPENLQSSSKADELDEAISSLEEVISGIEEAESGAETSPKHADQQITISHNLLLITRLCATLAIDYGSTLEDVLLLNLQKLRSRAERNVINGNGDNR